MPSFTLNPASEEVADFIYRFGSLQNNLRDPEQFPCVDYVSNDYAIFYTPLNCLFYPFRRLCHGSFRYSGSFTDTSSF